MCAPDSGMHLRVSLFVCLSFVAALLGGTVGTPPTPPLPALTFNVAGDDPGSWPQILSAVGFQPLAAGAADIVVLRPGAVAVPQLTERVEQGAFVILEGQSAAAEHFGFHAAK